jgi:hypothetical protein
MRNWQAKIRPHWTHWIEIVLAAAVVVVAAAVGTVQIFIYRQQAKIMGTQAEIAQRQADIMNTQAGVAQRQLAEMQSEGRAWVSIEPFIGGAMWDADGLHIDFNFVTKNTGKLPALYVIMDARLETYFAQGKNPITELQKMMSENKKSTLGTGYPLFPNETREWQLTLTFTRADIDKYLQFMSTMRPVGHPEAPPPPPREHEYIPLTVVYLVDYIFGGDAAHHQHWCMGEITARQPDETYGHGLRLNENVPALHVLLTANPFNCGAD